MTRILFYVFLLLTVVHFLQAETPVYADRVKAALIFRKDVGLLTGGDSSFNKKFRELYPHTLNVYLRLKNDREDNVSGTFKFWTGILPELLDARGHLVPEEPHMSRSNAALTAQFIVPWASSLDLYLPQLPFLGAESHHDEYLFIVGLHYWYIPMKTVATHSLKIQMFGFPQTCFIHSNNPNDSIPGLPSTQVDDYPSADVKPQLLLAVPPTKIVITN